MVALPEQSCGAPAFGYSPLPRVFGIGHRLPADLTSDDMYGPDPIYDLAATDASFEESRQIREAGMKAHAELSIRDRIEDSVRARPRTQTVLRRRHGVEDEPTIETWPVVWTRCVHWNASRECVGQHARISVEVQPASVQIGYY